MKCRLFHTQGFDLIQIKVRPAWCGGVKRASESEAVMMLVKRCDAEGDAAAGAGSIKSAHISCRKPSCPPDPRLLAAGPSSSSTESQRGSVGPLTHTIALLNTHNEPPFCRNLKAERTFIRCQALTFYSTRDLTLRRVHQSLSFYPPSVIN